MNTILFQQGEILSCARCHADLYRVTQDIEEGLAHTESHLESLPGIPSVMDGGKIHCPLCKFWDIAGPYWTFVGNITPQKDRPSGLLEPVIELRGITPPKNGIAQALDNLFNRPKSEPEVLSSAPVKSDNPIKQAWDGMWKGFKH